MQRLHTAVATLLAALTGCEIEQEGDDGGARFAEPSLLNDATLLAHSQNFDARHPPSHLWDGCLDGTPECTTGTPSAGSFWLELDFGQVRALSSARLFGDADGTWWSSRWTLEHRSQSSQAWETAFRDADALHSGWSTRPLDVSARYVRVTVVGNGAASATQARELQISGPGAPPPPPPPPPSTGDGVTVDADFEDGKVPAGSATKMKVPPRLVTEGGNTFYRITGSSSDKQSIPSTLPPPYDRMNRSTKAVTKHYSAMPQINDANRRQHYRARLRINTKCPHGCSLFELFQNSSGGSGGYNAPGGPNNLIRFGYDHSVGQVNIEERWYKSDGSSGGRKTNLGHVALNTWHTYEIKAVFSHDPNVGRYEIYIDGKLELTVTGRDTNLWHKSNQLPHVKFGLYGIDATGTLDLDDVRIQEW